MWMKISGATERQALILDNQKRWRWFKGGGIFNKALYLLKECVHLNRTTIESAIGILDLNTVEEYASLICRHAIPAKCNASSEIPTSSQRISREKK